MNAFEAEVRELLQEYLAGPITPDTLELLSSRCMAIAIRVRTAKTLNNLADAGVAKIKEVLTRRR